MTIDFSSLPKDRLESMAAAGAEIRECYRVLEKGGLNVVGEVLKDQGTFYEWNHYPDGDVYDNESHSQYYYHNHREDEHGHFHVFQRKRGMPKGTKPVPYNGKEKWPKGNDALSHLIAISMDQYGYPIGLFTTNRWVTGECWYTGDDVVAMLDRFVIDHAFPSWPVNRWISAMVALFQPQIVELVKARDTAVASWRLTHSGVDVFEDRDLEVTSDQNISVDDQIAAVNKALGV